MTIYADTSVLVAWFYPADQFARAVTEWCRRHEAEFSWNSFLRAELRHNLRRLSGNYAAVAWNAYRASEKSNRLRLGRDRLQDMLEWGDELSTLHPAQTSSGTWDCVHVAAAQHSGAEAFATCDGAQAELARLAKLKRVQLFT